MDNYWVPVESSKNMPPDAVVGGHDSDGSVIYVGRASHDGYHLPANVIPSKNYVSISTFKTEFPKTQYDVLTGSNYKWVPGKDGSVPQHAVMGGNSENGEVLFVGRGHWEGSLKVGKVHPSLHRLYIPFKGGETKLDTYEVLTHIMQQECRTSACLSSTWVFTSASCVPENAVLLDEEKSIYVGRAFHKGVLLPAMVIPDKASAYVFSAEGKVEKFWFEVLTGDKYRWEAAEFGNVPPGAVEGSRTDRDEPLYIGRTGYLGSTTVGQVKQSDGCMYIMVDGKQVAVSSYEVLVYGDSEISLVGYPH